jgi:2-keto-3-deoxy-6-phosphogluconate aldolase
MRSDWTLKEQVLTELTTTGRAALHQAPPEGGLGEIRQAMYDGGARCLEITKTTPACWRRSRRYPRISRADARGRGTVLDVCSARR